ncbi:cation:proton antiporter [Kytococcus sedentarius]|uniref:cation:proton antiporter domain-containing protein n=1 Tax=Kytococcus sedentarius TaxID=1276 RepID=UPI001950D73F|nr:cation:proton antiporter [Kytococcus sedentarius]QRO87499.1 cation:proton antiporter [Kytococcus sedentarius]
MDVLPLTLALTGLAGMVLAVFSAPMERRVPVTGPMAALTLGVLAGPAVLGLVRVPDATRDLLLLEGSRILLAASVMAAALRYPARSLGSLWRPTLVLLAVVMPLSALATGVVGLAAGIPVSLALVVGACLAPTDPVLASAVVSGERAERTLPHRLRSMVSLESGANDGLGVVFVAVAIALLTPGAGLGTAVAHVSWQLVLGMVVGALLGWAGGRALTWARDHHDVTDGPELVYSLLLALGVLGVCRLIDAADVLAVFVAGLVYNLVVNDVPRRSQEAVDEGINNFAVLPLFGLLGVVLPWAQWQEMGLLAAGVVVLGVLLVRRLPWVLAAARALELPPRQAAYAGFFGPMGVSALFYAAHAQHEGVGDPRLFGLVTLAVTASVMVHGLTGVPGHRLYARWFGEEGDTA